MLELSSLVMEMHTEWQEQMPEGAARRKSLARSVDLIVLGLVSAAVAAGVALVALAGDGPGSHASARPFPASLALHLESPTQLVNDGVTGWDQPADIAILGGRWFLLDTGNDRILELNQDGAVLQVIDERRDELISLRRPMALASDGRYLYVANSGSAEVLVLEHDGRVARTIALKDADPGDAVAARPIGIAVAPNGDLLVSDANGNRVLRYGPDGALLWTVGAGARSGGKEGFNTPAGIAFDPDGNILVVDILNGRVVRLSPQGSFLGQHGRLGDNAGTLSRPKDVAVDPAGNVYVSDNLLTAIQVFDSEGRYRGFIGLRDPNDRHAGALFQAPAGLAIEGGRLYVVDRLAGFFLIDLPSTD